MIHPYSIKCSFEKDDKILQNNLCAVLLTQLTFSCKQSQSMNQMRPKGYMHNVTQTMHSKSGSTNYFNFSLHASDIRKQQAICYDTNKQSLIASFQDFRQPISLLNITEKPTLLGPSERDLTLEKKSCIEPVNKDDIGRLPFVRTDRPGRTCCH